MRKIVIEVRGGNITEIYADSRDTQVTVVDWDNFDQKTRCGAVVTHSCTPYGEILRETQALIDESEKKEGGCSCESTPGS